MNNHYEYIKGCKRYKKNAQRRGRGIIKEVSPEEVENNVRQNILNNIAKQQEYYTDLGRMDLFKEEQVLWNKCMKQDGVVL